MGLDNAFFGAEFITERPDVLGQLPNLFCIGVVMHAIHKRSGLRFFANMLCNRPVSEQHEFLNQPVDLQPFLTNNINRPPGIVEHDAHFGKVEVNGPFGQPLVGKPLGEVCSEM